MSSITALADFASGVDFARVDSAVQERTLWIVADTVAAIVGGAAEPELRALAAAQAGGGPATLPGTGRRGSAEQAALVNGCAGTFLEMDEGNRYARGHPAIHVLPAALACCEQQGLDAPTFLSALLAGYELCSRVGAASRLRGGLHPHGTWGTLGAAAACGRAVRLQAGQMAELVGIASSLMTATSKKTMLQGGLVRNLYAGLSNRNGLLALQLLQCGFSAEHDGVQNQFGELLSDRLDIPALSAGLGHDWHVLQNYFKLHACCRYNHGVLDALDSLAARGALPPAAAVVRVDVESYDLAAELADPAPRNTLAAKFSIPFAVATRLVHGHSGVASFTWDAVHSEPVRALARRVTLREDPAMTRRLPQERPARITVHNLDGSVVQAEVGSNRGDDASPYTAQEISAKFLALTARAWPRAHGERLLEATLALGRPGASIADWCALLAREPQD